MKYLAKLILFAGILASSNSVFAQTITISGKLYSTEGDSVPGASVMLIGAQDSILKTYAISKKSGDFALLNVKSGDYILKASFFGYLPYEQNVSVAEGASNMDLGKIILQPKTLKTVTVDGQYIPIQIKGDTIEYDSRAFEVKEHDVVEDLLKQLPGVEVEEDGTIKVQGKDVEQVLVDGEKFFGDDPKVTTKNLPANAVSKVQVFDKTSEMSEFTGVDDGSQSPTINIKLKETHKKGVFGNVQAAGGTQVPTNNTLRYEGKANVFSFKKKWQFSVIGMSNNINQTGFTWSDYSNFMGGAATFGRGGGDVGGLNVNGGEPSDGFLQTHATGVNFRYKPSGQTTLSTSFFFNSFDKNYNKILDRETYFTDSTLFTNEEAIQQSNSLNGKTDIFFEQKFDSTHVLNLTLKGDIGQTIYDNTNQTLNSTDDNVLVSQFNTGLDQTNFNYSLNAGANYRKKFNKGGRYTGGDISYNRTNKDLTTYLDYLTSLVNNGVPFNVLTSQQQLSVESTEKLAGSWTWSEPISKNQLLQFDLGLNRNTESRNRKVYDDTSTVQVINPFLSGIGDYLQMHYNGEVRHKFFGNKVKTTVGAQYKYLTLSGQDLFAGNKEYQYILPSAMMEWDPNKKTNTRLNYSTSIAAPSLNQLQPLQDNTNPSQVILGNLNLLPEYSHNLSFRLHSFNQFNFRFFMVRLSGGYTQNNIVYSQQINQYYITELIPQNIGTEKSANVFLTYGTSIHKLKTKFRVSGSTGISNGLVNLNGTQDSYTTYTVSPSLRLENIGKKVLDLRGGVSYNWSLNTYKLNQNFNNNYQNINYYVNASVNIKDRWIINPKMQHYFYPGFTTNKQVLLIDFTVACNLLESRKLQIYVSGKDMLNQNTGISQYYLQNMYERSVTQTLGRYFMLGVKYSFQRVGGKVEKEDKE
ncbi:MAG: TonB-dependent receptor [Crocinitomicaceae bacterium]|nr:TonB-dependent receptor [Crocinitomicaceae bacterium]